MTSIHTLKNIRENKEKKLYFYAKTAKPLHLVFTFYSALNVMKITAFLHMFYISSLFYLNFMLIMLNGIVSLEISKWSGYGDAKKVPIFSIKLQIIKFLYSFIYLQCLTRMAQFNCKLV